MVHRKGLGNIRHLDANTLLLQQATYTRRIQYLKVLGTLNPADIFTKHLALADRTVHCKKMGLVFLSGRPAAAPKLSKK